MCGLLALGLGACAGGAPAGELPWFAQPTATPGAAPASEEPETASTEPDPAPRRVLVIGDSYTAGEGVPAGTSWAWAACRELGWECVIDGVGGSGYIRASVQDPTGAPFAERLELWSGRLAFDIDAVVLEGGLNDWQSTTVEIREAVATTVAAARTRFPGADVIVLGLAAPVAQQDTRLANAAAVAAGAREAGATFVDTMGADRWLDAANSDGFDLGDGLHVNAAGHRYLADRFATAMKHLDEDGSAADATDATAEAVAR